MKRWRFKWDEGSQKSARRRLRIEHTCMEHTIELRFVSVSHLSVTDGTSSECIVFEHCETIFLLGTAVSGVNFSVVMILSGYRSRELLFLGGFGCDARQGIHNAEQNDTEMRHCSIFIHSSAHG